MTDIYKNFLGLCISDFDPENCKNIIEVGITIHIMILYIHPRILKTCMSCSCISADSQIEVFSMVRANIIEIEGIDVYLMVIGPPSRWNFAESCIHLLGSQIVPLFQLLETFSIYFVLNICENCSDCFEF